MTKSFDNDAVVLILNRMIDEGINTEAVVVTSRKGEVFAFPLLGLRGVDEPWHDAIKRHQHPADTAAIFKFRKVNLVDSNDIENSALGAYTVQRIGLDIDGKLLNRVMACGLKNTTQGPRVDQVLGLDTAAGFDLAGLLPYAAQPSITLLLKRLLGRTDQLQNTELEGYIQLNQKEFNKHHAKYH